MARPRDVSFRIVARDFTRGAFRRIGRSLVALRSAILSANALLGTLVGAGIVRLGTQAARASRQIRTFSEAFGFTATEAQALDIGMRRVGGTFEQVEDAFNAFVGRLGDIGEGTAQGARFLEVLQQLGFSSAEISDAFDNPQQAFRRLVAIAGDPNLVKFQGLIQELTSEGGARGLRRFSTVIGDLDAAVARFTAEGLIQTEAQLASQAELANRLDATYERISQQAAEVLVNNEEALQVVLQTAEEILKVLANMDLVIQSVKENAEFLPRTGEAIGERAFELFGSNQALENRAAAAADFALGVAPGGEALRVLRRIATNTENSGGFQ